MRTLEKTNKGNLLIVEINLRSISNLNSFFNLMESEFDFPNYFNHNLDSLDECMRDLNWIEESQVKIIVNNINSIKEKNIKLFKDVENCFSIYKEYWNDENKKNKYVEIQY